MTKINTTEAEVLRQLCERLAEAPFGARDALKQQAANTLRCSMATLHRKLNAYGYRSGRKRRIDAGTTKLGADKVALIAGVLQASTNGKGQAMPIRVAVEMLHAGGLLGQPVSVSTVSRQLRAQAMHPAQLRLPSPAVRMASLHPNHVYQMDSTTGAFYYMPGGRLRWVEERDFNKNKVHNLVKIGNDLLTRYVLVDHASGAFKIMHFLGGESAQNAVAFLVWAFWKQDGVPMWGVPNILMTDQGSGYKSKLFATFCENLGIRHERHSPGNARATGSAEKVHDIVRQNFETRLKFMDQDEMSLEVLNERVQAWALAYNATRKHSRHGMTRFGAWLRITQDQPRVPASQEALKDAATHAPEKRRVDNTRRISFQGRTYSLELLPDAVPGLPVLVRLNVYRAPDIDVQCVNPDTGEETWHQVAPEVVNEWGYPAEQAAIGEGFRSHASTAMDRNRNALVREAYRGDALPTLEEAEKRRKEHAQAFGGRVDAMADVAAATVPSFIPKRITALDLPRREVEARRLSIVDAAKRLRERLGGAYTPQVFGHLARDWPDGVPEDQLGAIERRLRGLDDDQAAVAVQGA